ncbi:MAG: hypothetical protein GKR95_24635 [Gammaproteobacteria bacterium]|nr:hypothetical protein [Gammaproteobacteria bacterium]NKB65152.1 hypothetical protein [Gammaproteobacteria bacterium]
MASIMDMSVFQWIIMITGITAIGLTQQPWWPKAERLAPFVGLASQPVWLYETYTSMQMGMFINSCAFTLVWLLGIYK